MHRANQCADCKGAEGGGGYRTYLGTVSSYTLLMVSCGRLRTTICLTPQPNLNICKNTAWQPGCSMLRVTADKESASVAVYDVASYRVSRWQDLGKGARVCFVSCERQGK